MEAQPPHSRASITVHPTRSALPPDGAVRVAPHTVQGITLVALEKTTTSAPQSRHDTFKNLLAIKTPSLIYQFKFLSPFAGCVMSFSSLSTPE
tara:strand:- start:10715 stop:10993 length:279 start_codon:yes stop_codon:yes gene_type:complete